STNLALMRAELGVSDADRVGNEVKEVLVRNETEFLKALGSYRKIILEDGLHLNLSKAIESLSVCNEAGILMVGAYADLEDRTGLFSEEVFDGRQLVIKGLRKLTIQGGQDCRIVVDPRYSYIFRFVDCQEIVLDNLTLGHTEGGYCEGGVLGLESCTYVDIYRCDLYGCGTYGIEASHCTSIYMSASIIRDCSYGILLLNACREFNSENCDFYRNREFDLISANSACSGIMFYNCRFSQNQGVLFDLDIDIRLEDCEVHHDLTKLGSMSEVSDANTTWDGKNIDLPARQIGPDSGAEVF
ncbi:MAG: right-handed parallel beta-helix repeat-containing protein, partial [Bacteroidales bacterium]|nr:right-handed parallel beta-helix repeat-containing protein [Bacteroidales bacterium]